LFIFLLISWQLFYLLMRSISHLYCKEKVQRKKMTIALFIALFISVPQGKGKYYNVFGEDYKNAAGFIDSHSKEIENTCRKHKTNYNYVKAIIFPELIRYSSFRDFLETEALEWLYEEGGSKSADFSIGHFQMKPSFVERLEEYVSSDESLGKEYGFITEYDGGSSVRKQRITRMKELSWQLSYLSCFADVMQHRFGKLKSPSEEMTLKFICSAYNTGFHKSPEIILSNISAIQFPYGHKFKGGNSCSYALLSWDYYSHYLQK